MTNELQGLTIHQKLNFIQTNLKVEKGHRNNFGKYNYRNLADIFEAVKPLLNETGCWLTVSDEMVNIGNSNYIKAVAIFGDQDGTEITCEGWARESVSKKGMDDSQITGATSSYARKYACNGLFAIDDTKDADSMDNTDHISELQGNTLGTVKTVSDEEIKLERLCRAVEFKGTGLQSKIKDWLKTEPSQTQILEKYIQLKDKQEGIRNKNKKQKESK